MFLARSGDPAAGLQGQGSDSRVVSGRTLSTLQLPVHNETPLRGKEIYRTREGISYKVRSTNEQTKPIYTVEQLKRSATISKFSTMICFLLKKEEIDLSRNKNRKLKIITVLDTSHTHFFSNPTYTPSYHTNNIT